MLSAQSGSIESFEILISLHRATVFKYLLRYYQPLDIVEDVCLEAFLRVWLNRAESLRQRFWFGLDETQDIFHHFWILFVLRK